jgi:hypothetical protein
MLSQSTFDRSRPSAICSDTHVCKAHRGRGCQANKTGDRFDAFRSSRSTTSTSNNEESLIVSRNDMEPENLGGTACHRMDRQLSK